KLRWAPHEGAHVPRYRHARLPALHRGDFFTQPPHFLAWTGGSYRSRYPGGIGAAVHPDPSSHLRRTPHRGRAVTAPPGRGFRAPPAGAAIPAPPTRRLRKPPSVSRDGKGYRPRSNVRQVYVRTMYKI